MANNEDNKIKELYKADNIISGYLGKMGKDIVNTEYISEGTDEIFGKFIDSFGLGDFMLSISKEYKKIGQDLELLTDQEKSNLLKKAETLKSVFDFNGTKKDIYAAKREISNKLNDKKVAEIQKLDLQKQLLEINEIEEDLNIYFEDKGQIILDTLKLLESIQNRKNILNKKTFNAYIDAVNTKKASIKSQLRENGVTDKELIKMEDTINEAVGYDVSRKIKGNKKSRTPANSKDKDKPVLTMGDFDSFVIDKKIVPGQVMENNIDGIKEKVERKSIGVKADSLKFDKRKKEDKQLYNLLYNNGIEKIGDATLNQLLKAADLLDEIIPKANNDAAKILREKILNVLVEAFENTEDLEIKEEFTKKVFLKRAYSDEELNELASAALSNGEDIGSEFGEYYNKGAAADELRKRLRDKGVKESFFRSSDIGRISQDTTKDDRFLREAQDKQERYEEKRKSIEYETQDLIARLTTKLIGLTTFNEIVEENAKNGVDVLLEIFGETAASIITGITGEDIYKEKKSYSSGGVEIAFPKVKSLQEKMYASEDNDGIELQDTLIDSYSGQIYREDSTSEILRGILQRALTKLNEEYEERVDKEGLNIFLVKKELIENMQDSLDMISPENRYDIILDLSDPSLFTGKITDIIQVLWEKIITEGLQRQNSENFSKSISSANKTMQILDESEQLRRDTASSEFLKLEDEKKQISPLEALKIWNSSQENFKTDSPEKLGEAFLTLQKLLEMAKKAIEGSEQLSEELKDYAIRRLNLVNSSRKHEDDLNELRNRISGVLTFADNIDIAMGDRSEKLKKIAKDSTITSKEEQIEEWYTRATPEVQKSYNRSKEAIERFENAGGVSNINEALDAFFNTEDKYILSLKHKYEKLKEFFVSNINNPLGQNAIRIDEKTLLKQDLKDRLNPLRLHNPDAKKGKKYYTELGITGLKLSKEEKDGLSYALITNLDYLGGMVGNAYMTETNDDDILINIKNRLKNAEKYKLELLKKIENDDLSEFLEKKYKAEIKLIDLDIASLEKAMKKRKPRKKAANKSATNASNKNTNASQNNSTNPTQMIALNNTSADDNLGDDKNNSQKQKKDSTQNKKTVAKLKKQKQVGQLPINKLGSNGNDLQILDNTQNSAEVINNEINNKKTSSKKPEVKKKKEDNVLTLDKQLNSKADEFSDLKTEKIEIVVPLPPEIDKDEIKLPEIEPLEIPLEAVVETNLENFSESIDKATEAEKLKVLISEKLLENFVEESKDADIATESLVKHDEELNKTEGRISYKYAKLSFDEGKHEYLTEDGKKVLSATLIRDLLLGIGNKSGKEDYRRVNDTLNNLSRGEVLKKEDVGILDDNSFNNISFVIKSGIKGDVFHKAIELMAKESVWSIKELSEQGYKEYKDFLDKNIEKIEKLGVDSSYIDPSKNISAYSEMAKNAGMSLSQFTELPLGLSITNGKSEYTIGVTPDQIGILDYSKEGIQIDNKTGAVKGYESLLLTLGLLAELAAMKDPSFDGNLKLLLQNANLTEDTKLYIADIGDGFVKLVEYLRLTDEEVFNLVEKAYGISSGIDEPFASKAEWQKAMDRRLTTGSYIGGNYTLINNSEDTNLNKDIEKYLVWYERVLNIYSLIYDLLQKSKVLTGDDLKKNEANIKLLLAKLEDKNLNEIKLDKSKLSPNQLNKLETGKRSKENIYAANSDKANAIVSAMRNDANEKQIKDYLSWYKDIAKVLAEIYDLKQKSTVLDGEELKANNAALNSANSKLEALKSQSVVLDKSKLTQEQLSQFEKERNAIKSGYSANTAKTDADISNIRENDKNKLNINYIKQLAQLRKLESMLQRAGYRISNATTSQQQIDYQAESTVLQQRIDAIKNNKSFRDFDVNQLSAEEQAKVLDIEQKRAQEANNINGYYRLQQTIFQKLFGTVQQSVNRFFDFTAATMIINKVRDTVKQVIGYVQELDSKIVDLQIATGGTRDLMKAMLKDYNDIAKELGRTTASVADAANDWLRAGYEGKESAELVRASMYLSTLGVMKAEDATSALISVLKGWKLESSDIIGIVDKLVKVDMSAAVKASDIAEAMAKVNYSAQNAGMSIDTLIGLLTTGMEVSQLAPELVGNAWRTVFARANNVKAQKFVATQEDTQAEGYDEQEFEALNDVETVLGSMGIQMRETATKWREVEDILNEIAMNWNTYNGVQQSAIANAMAGTRQREQFMVAMQNWDSVLAYEGIAMDSYGTAAEKMTAYTDSIEAARNRITAAIEELALNIKGTELFKDFYRVIAFLTENLGAIATLGGLILIITNLGLVINMGINAFGSLRTRLIDVSNAFTGLKRSISAITSQATDRRNTVSRYINQYGVDKRIDSYADNIAKLGINPGKIGAFKATYRELLSLSNDEQSGTASVISKLIDINRNQDPFKLGAMLNGQDILYGSSSESKTNFLNALGSYTGDQELNNYITALNLLTSGTKDFGLALERARKLLEDPDIEKAFSEYQRGMEESRKKTKMATEGMTDLIAGGIGLLSGQFIGGKIGEKFGGENWKATGLLIDGTINSVISTKLADSLNKSIEKANGSFILGIRNLDGLSKVGIIAEGVLSIFQIIVAWRQELAKKQQERVKEAIDNLSTTQSSYSIAQLIDKLAYGVDSLGRNVTLSNEDYEKFINLNNQLGEQYPSLINRTDELGNTFLDLNKAGGGLTAKFEELIRVALRRADSEFMQVKGGESEYSRLTKAAAENIKNTEQQRNKAIKSAENKLKRSDFLNVDESITPFDTYNDYSQKLTFDLEKMNSEQRLALEKAAKDYNLIIEDGLKEFEITVSTQDLDSNPFLETMSNYLINSSDYDLIVKDQKSLMVDTYNVRIRYMRDLADAEAMKLLENTTAEKQAIINAALAIIDPGNSEAELPLIIGKLNHMFDQMEGQKYGDYSFEELMYMTPEDFDTYDEGVAARGALKEFLLEWVGDEIDDFERAILVKAHFEVEADGVTIADETDLVDKIQKAADELGIDNIDTKYLKGLSMADLNNVYNWLEKGYINGSGDASQQIKDMIKVNKTASTSDEAKELALQLAINSQNYVNNGSIDNFLMQAQRYKEISIDDVMGQFSLMPINVLESIKKAYDEELESLKELAKEYASSNMTLEEYTARKEKLFKDASNKVEEAIANEIDSLNEQRARLAMQKEFKNIDLGSDGLISSAEEMISVIDAMVESMNKLVAAEEEVKEKGEVSLKTFSELIALNPDNIELFNFNNGNITVADNAEEKMFLLQKEATLLSIQEQKRNLEGQLAEAEGRRNKTQAIIDEIKAYGHAITVEEQEVDSALNAAQTETEAIATLGDLADATRCRLAAMWATAAEDGTYNGATAELWLGNAILYDNANSKALVTANFDKIANDYKEKKTYYDRSDLDSLEELLGELSEEVKKLREQYEYFSQAELSVQQTDNANEMYTNLDRATKAIDRLADAVSLLDAKIGAMNKEWYQMQAWQNGQTVAKGGMDSYYSQMRTFLQEKLKALRAQLVTLNENTEEYYKVIAEIAQTEVDEANIDDEQAEDKITILESQGLLNDNVIAAYGELLNTADTEAEYYEYLKRMNDKIKEQKNLVKQLLGFQQDLLTTLREYEKYTPNSDYYANIITRSESNLRQQMLAAADRATNAYNQLYEASYNNWIENGAEESVAQQKAAYEASQDSDYQLAVKDYIDAYQSLATLALDVFNEKIDALQRKIDDLEKSKSQEWSSIDQIREYYTAMDELQKQIRDQAKETLNYIDDMTDEQVQEVVDKYNDAIKEINQNMIDQYSDIKEYQESIYSALGNEVGRYKEQLEEQKKVIEEQYDEELKRLQDKQTSISRTNKLLEIQNNIRNAGQEKERVYREGKMDALYKCGIKRLKARNGSDRAKFILQLIV